MLSVGFNSINPYLLYGWLPLVLLIAVVTDLLYRRIPNLLTGSTIIIAMAAHFFFSGINGLLFGLFGLLLAFGLFIFPYMAGGMGAGDVKLISSVGAVLGWQNTLVSILFIALTGGVMALAVILRENSFKNTLLRIYTSFILLVGQKRISALKHDRHQTIQYGIPYGVAISCGTLFFILYMILAHNTFRFLPT